MSDDSKRLRLIVSLQTAPMRTCYSMHECYFCDQGIRLHEHYLDRGYGRRAHYSCTPGMGTEATCEEHEAITRGAL